MLYLPRHAELRAVVVRAGLGGYMTDSVASDSIWNEVAEATRRHTNRYVEAHKADGRPVVGTFCSNTPPEIILAAGALPLRLRAPESTDSTSGDALLSGRLCTYVRHVVSLALDGAYDFLDGEVSSNVCDHVRRASDVLRHKTKIGFHGFLSVPRVQRASLFLYYRRQLEKLRQELSQHFDVNVSDDALRAAIRACNANRRRLSRLDALRREERPRISGAQALSVHIAAQVMPPSAFAELFDRLYEVIARGSPGLETPRARLVLVGAELDDPRYIETIESQGAVVVADTLTFGSRAAHTLVDEDSDHPLDAIARAYFFAPSGARTMGGFDARYAELKTLVTSARADGVVCERMVFCDPWAADQHNLGWRSKETDDFPVLLLTREHGVVPRGQLKTRIQAFVERIEIRNARHGARRGAA